jgi:nucleoid-associated protein YgaU
MKKQDDRHETSNHSISSQPTPCRQSWSADAIKKALAGLIIGAGATVNLSCGGVPSSVKLAGDMPATRLQTPPDTQPAAATRPADITTRPVGITGGIRANNLEVTTRPVATMGVLLPTRLEVKPAGPDAFASKTYTVVEGDTLFSIAKKSYGDGSLCKAIQKSNPGLRPAAMRVGQTLIIPSLDEAKRLTADNNQSDN